MKIEVDAEVAATIAHMLRHQAIQAHASSSYASSAEDTAEYAMSKILFDALNELSPPHVGNGWDAEALSLAKQLAWRLDMGRTRPSQIVNTMHLSMLGAFRFAREQALREPAPDTSSADLAGKQVAKLLKDTKEEIHQPPPRNVRKSPRYQVKPPKESK